jgi:hypothetical protein
LRLLFDLFDFGSLLFLLVLLFLFRAGFLFRHSLRGLRY